MNLENPITPNNENEIKESKQEILLKEVKALSNELYEKDIDKKMSDIKQQMDQMGDVYENEDYYKLQEELENLESQKNIDHEELYIGEGEIRYEEIEEKISINYEQIDKLKTDYVQKLEMQMSKMDAYDDENYYKLQEELDRIKELKSEDLYNLSKKSFDLNIEDETVKEIMNKSAEINALFEESKDLVQELKKDQLAYMIKKLEFKYEVAKALEEKEQAQENTNDLLKEETEEVSAIEEVNPEKEETGIYEVEDTDLDNIKEAESLNTWEIKGSDEPEKDFSTIHEVEDTNLDNVKEGESLEIQEIESILEDISHRLGRKKEVPIKYEDLDVSVEVPDDFAKKTAEALEEINKDKESLSPEKQKLFDRLKKDKAFEKKILIAAIATGLAVWVPLASIAMGGGLFGFGAGLSIPVLEAVGLAAHSVAIGGPLGAVSIFAATHIGLNKIFKDKQNEGGDIKDKIKETEDIVNNISSEDMAKLEEIIKKNKI